MSFEIYVGHSRDKEFNYQTDLYQPLKSVLAEHRVYFPHDGEKGAKGVNSKELLPRCQLMIAEVSYPSTGLGMELVWAEQANVPILCVHKVGHAVSSSVTNYIRAQILTYTDKTDMAKKVFEWIEAHSHEFKKTTSPIKLSL